MNHSLANYIKRFFSHYLPVQKGLATNSIQAYRDAIKLLLCYAADTLVRSVDQLTVEDITEKVVLAFLDHVEDGRGCTAGTRNARLAAIRSLFAFIAREEPVLIPECQRIRAIPLKRTQHATVEYLEEEEMQAMLDAVDINSRTGIRDLALLLLLYNTGARVSEIVTLKIKDLRLAETGQVHLLGKGGKHRACPLWPETVEALQDYLGQRTPSTPELEQIFLNANSAPITRFGIRYVIRKYATVAQQHCPTIKTKNVTPHTIRHTTAMHLLRSGNEINTISYWLGHADINTTHIYVEIDMEMKRKMLEKADAPNINKEKLWRQPDILKWLNGITRRSELCEVNR